MSFPVPVRRMRRRGMGAAVYSPTIQAAQGAAVSAAGAIGTAAGGPLGGAIATAAAEIGVMISDLWAGCGQTCVQATEYANQTEPLLLQNLQQYLEEPVHYASIQAAYLDNFDAAWNALTSACGNPALGSAGQHCISDRQRGACVSKNATPGGWFQDSSGNWQYQFATGPNSGSNCWNWFIGYRDPIANDPTVVADPIPGSSLIPTSLLSAVGISPSATVFGIPIADVIMGGLSLFALSWVASEI